MIRKTADRVYTLDTRQLGFVASFVVIIIVPSSVYFLHLFCSGAFAYWLLIRRVAPTFLRAD